MNLSYSKKAVICFIIAFSFLALHVSAQRATNSVLVNFGRDDCSYSYFGSDITLIADAESSPDLLLQCNTDATIGNVFSKFVSYNSINNKLYINDIGDNTNSNIYILNIGLPANCTCPNISGVSYTIPNVVLSQFEFDALGDLYALSNYDASTGIANIGAYDDTTGLLQPGSLKTLYFPAGHFPADVLNGDIVITPNGRMFCVFGGDTSKLFEITNFSKTVTGDAIATFLGSPTRVCYAMAFDNGYLLMGGTDLGGYCYSFRYNIATVELSDEISSPLNDMPIDDTSFSPSVAVGMRLTSSTQVDATHFDLTYQIYIKNLGNVKVGNIALTCDLASLFGSANISNISTSWLSNGAGLSLNAAYNGYTSLKIIGSGASQTLQNYPASKTSSTVELKVRVANPTLDYVYNNSAVFTGKIGRDSTLLTVLDSSNNYLASFESWNVAIDPNINNVADDSAEGIPTPWQTGISLPIELTEFSVQREGSGALLGWSTSSEKDSRYFAIERSADAVVFDSVGIVKGAGTSSTGNSYSFFDQGPPKTTTTYYRLRQMNANGSFSYSQVKVLNDDAHDEDEEVKYRIYPNPVVNFIIYESSGISDRDAIVEVRDVFGLKVLVTTIPGSTLRQKIMLPELPNGYYFVTVKNAAQSGGFFKIFVNEKK